MEWKKNFPCLLGAVIIAFGLIIAANSIADRPMQGNLNGSIVTSGGSYAYPELMETQSLLDYLMIYPDKPRDIAIESDDMNQPPQPVPELDQYEIDRQNLVKEFETSILGGAWPDFPYVQIKGRMYFSKAAVDAWFLEKANQQLIIK